MASAVIRCRIVEFAGGFHRIGCGGNGGADAGVIACIEAVNGSDDGRNVGGSGAVEDEGGAEIGAMRGEGEGFGSSPAESGDGDSAVGGGQLLAVVGRGIEIGQHPGGIESGDGFDAVILAGEGIGAATAGTVAAEQVGSDDDEAFAGQLVGHLFGPVAEPEDFVDENHDGCLVFDLRVDDQSLQGARGMLEGDIFAMARRSFQASFGPVLRVCGDGEQGKSERQREKKRKRAGGSHFHAEKCSDGGRSSQACDGNGRGDEGESEEGSRPFIHALKPAAPFDAEDGMPTSG